MYSSLLALIAVPAIALAQTTTTALASTGATATSCNPRDGYCQATSNGWNPAAASYLETATFDAALLSRVTAAVSTAAANPSLSAVIASYVSANVNDMGAAKVSALEVELSYILPSSDLQQYTSYIAVAQSLNGSLPQATSTQQTSTSHAAAAAVAKPTDMAFMAMAGAVAGVAGLAYAL